MKARVIKTGEIVEVYHEPQHGQITNIYKEAVLVNGRMWNANELDFNCITKENKAPESYTNAHRGERADDVLSQMRGEPVSEDLEKVSKEWLRPQLDKSYEKYGKNKMMQLTHFDGYAMLEAIEFGAKWKEEQMMAKAIDGTVMPYDGEVWCDLKTFNFNEGDKVKIVIVKSE